MARTPLLIDITPLKRSPGTRQALIRSFEPQSEIGLETAEITADLIRLDLQLEIAGEELVVSGELGIDWSGPCRRCLEDQTGTTTTAIREIFQKHPVEGETWKLDENEVDLSPLVRETALLNLPVAPLCREDCRGPDPERFPASVEADPAAGDGDEAGERPVDPRWAALSSIEFDED